MSNYGFTSAGTSYDDEDRLTGFARASGTFTQSWSLTSVGDWNSITTNGTAQNRTHGPTHELLTAGGQNVTTDVKGNITLLPTTLTTSGVAMAVGYDFDNKLKSADVDNNGSNDVTFQYDALGRRVARQGTSGSFVYVQHDQQTIADYGYGDAPSSPTHRYVYASYIDEPVVRKAAGTSGTIHYYHRNQQFSITAVTTSSGSVAERYAYTAYGQPTILDSSGSVLSSSAINNRYTYTGREWDQTLGLHHFRARWMSGLAGRFMGRDPIKYIGSPYLLTSFFRNRPFRYVDPSGLKSTIGFGHSVPIGRNGEVYFQITVEVGADGVCVTVLGTRDITMEDWNDSMGDWHFGGDRDPIDVDGWDFPNFPLILNGDDDENSYGGPYESNGQFYADDDYLELSVSLGCGNVGGGGSGDTNTWANPAGHSPENSLVHQAQSGRVCVPTCECGNIGILNISLDYADEEHGENYGSFDVPIGPNNGPITPIGDPRPGRPTKR